MSKRCLRIFTRYNETLAFFWRLLEDADVVAQNYRAGKLENLGIGYEEARKRKPDIIYVSLNWIEQTDFPKEMTSTPNSISRS